jgi:hypothetical protein
MVAHLHHHKRYVTKKNAKTAVISNWWILFIFHFGLSLSSFGLENNECINGAGLLTKNKDGLLLMFEVFEFLLVLIPTVIIFFCSGHVMLVLRRRRRVMVQLQRHIQNFTTLE